MTFDYDRAVECEACQMLYQPEDMEAEICWQCRNEVQERNARIEQQIDAWRDRQFERKEGSHA